MEALATVAKTFEVNVGVGPGVAQALAWISVLLISYLAMQLVHSMVFGGGLRKKKARGQKLFIIGQNGAGKTALFFRLRDCVPVNSVSSLKPLRDTMKIKQEAQKSENGGTAEDAHTDDDGIGPVEVVDFPGHNRLRGKLTEIIAEARCIVYVVDSEDKAKLKDVAEHLYELFTNQDVCELRIPVLLTLNKVDLPGARTEKSILEELDREIEQMRVSRSATLEGQDQADSYLGVDGEKFKLLEHSPCPIETCRVSVKKPQLQPIYAFLRQHFA
jgi:signal recognition particle receptor subunit beta